MRTRKKVVVAALPATVGVVAMAWVLASAGRAPADTWMGTGTVEGTEAVVGFERAGRVEEVLVREGESVEFGQVVAVLDTTALHARRLQAEAAVLAARAALAELEGGSRPQEVSQANAALEGAQVKLADLRRDLARTRTLFEGGVVSLEAYDKAVTAVEVQEQQVRHAREQADLVRAGPRRERIDAQRAALAQAEAAVAEIEASLADAVVRAPFAGLVTVRHREPGEVVGPGSAAVSVLDRNERWARVWIPESLMAAVHVGAQAVITTDTYVDEQYAGELVFISPEAEFTPKTVQTQEERVKLVYAAKVRITGDPRHDLKPGMPADVRIALHGAGDER